MVYDVAIRRSHTSEAYIGGWSIHWSSNVWTYIPTNWYDYTLPFLMAYLNSLFWIWFSSSSCTVSVISSPLCPEVELWAEFWTGTCGGYNLKILNSSTNESMKNMKLRAISHSDTALKNKYYWLNHWGVNKGWRVYFQSIGLIDNV